MLDHAQREERRHQGPAARDAVRAVLEPAAGRQRVAAALRRHASLTGVS